MAKTSGPVPQAVKRRRNADSLAPQRQGVRRGIAQSVAPKPEWRVDVRNYFNAALNSGQADWYEPSDVMSLYMQCELLDRVLRGARTELVYETVEEEYQDNDGEWKTRYRPVLDEEGNKIPRLDEYGEEERRLVGAVNGQALKAVLDMGQDLLVTEGARRRLRIDLGMPDSGEEPPEKAIIAQQRASLHKALQKA